MGWGPKFHAVGSVIFFLKKNFPNECYGSAITIIIFLPHKERVIFVPTMRNGPSSFGPVVSEEGNEPTVNLLKISSPDPANEFEEIRRRQQQQFVW